MPRMVYLDGSLFLDVSVVSARTPHGTARLVRLEVVVEELDIPCIPSGSTTFRRRAKRGGVEGDQTYYLANEARSGARSTSTSRSIRLPTWRSRSSVTHDADAAVEVYRRLKVPEVWVCDQDELTILVLQPDGQYAEVESKRRVSGS